MPLGITYKYLRAFLLFSMKWTTITPENIKIYLHSTQMQLLQQDPSFLGEGFVIEKLIHDAIAELQLELNKTLYKNKEAATNEVPEGLLKSVCYLVIESLHGRFPLIQLTPDQIKNADQARALIARFREAEGEALAQQTISAAVDLLSARVPAVTAQTLKGL